MQTSIITRRRRWYISAYRYLILTGIVILISLSWRISSAFVTPRSTLQTSCTDLLQLQQRSISSCAKTKKIRRRRTSSIFVSLETPTTDDEIILQSNHNDTLPIDIIEGKEEVIESTHPVEIVTSLETDLTNVVIEEEEMYDEVDIQSIISPSIPISYDIKTGLVQADAVNIDNEMIVVESKDQDYPSFITFLFDKDENGQTLASKLFNVALLAASFGYVFVSVFNIDKGMTRGWSASEISLRIPLDTWASYENSLSEKPISTKTIINVVIYLLGDWLSQTLFCGKNVLDFDAGRTLKNGFVGCVFGPAVHEYYEFSDWILPVEGMTYGITNRAFKILMDQTIYLSIKCSIYILAIGILNGDGVKESGENVKNRIKPIMFTAWKFWPLVHCITYGLIPARHRILWVNSVDLVWNAILASKARSGDDEDELDTSNLNGDETAILEASSTGGLDDMLKKISMILNLETSSLDVQDDKIPTIVGSQDDTLNHNDNIPNHQLEITSNEEPTNTSSVEE